ncbi:Site-specific DNA recombinase [Amycolatopsis lurida]|nr:Site-specific DNA recombinase [Amycolatopsis lurida]
MRVAFLGRTSTEDLQDPRQSMLRQLANCKSAIPESWVIVAHFYDVESGRMELGDRGQGADYERFDIPVPRAGGIADLLKEAPSRTRTFDIVICEGISRVARRAFEGLSVERELERADVPLFASNEPITLSGSRAQRVLQRRINQSIAEYEVLNTLEQSWGGLCTHVRDGWNIGKPPYGYKAKVVPHPSPAKAEKGKTKSRLEPDSERAETVVQIALWRYHEGLGYNTIADRLNADPERYPPPTAPSKSRTRGAWSKSSVAGVLKNPKYTGYQVFNRRATTSKRGRVNEPFKWVWSPKPVHEPLIAKWMFDELTSRRETRRGSRADDQPNSNPSAERTYLFRGMVVHSCGRRMAGDTKHNRLFYYLCWPGKNNRGDTGPHAGLPAAIRLREDELLEAVSAFYSDRLFSPERRGIIETDLATVDDSAAQERRAEREHLQRQLTDVARRQDSVLRQAQDGAPDDPFAKALRQNYNKLEDDKSAAMAAIAHLNAEDEKQPAKPTSSDLNCLEGLPHLQLKLACAPQALLRRLFEITQLTVKVHGAGDQVTITIKLPVDQVPETAVAAERIHDAMTSTEMQKVPTAPVETFWVEAARTPDGIRTHATGVRGRRPRPLDDGG